MRDEMVHLRTSRAIMGAANRSTYRMDQEQAKELGRRLREQRERLGLSTRELAERASTTHTTIARFEQGAFDAPAPDKLSRIAAALDLSLADVFALAEYSVPSDLPSFSPYLRSKYRGLPTPAVEELERAFQRVAKRHGYQPYGPAPGEDEQPEPKPSKGKKGGDHDNPSTPRRRSRS
jgi:transcriptional regulator with XRE-family HTH domain